MTAAERATLRDLCDRIDAILRDEDGEESVTGARLAGGRNAGLIVVTYGYLRGSFQSIGYDEAAAYLAWLEAGNAGGPWQMPTRAQHPHPRSDHESNEPAASPAGSATGSSTEAGGVPRNG